MTSNKQKNNQMVDDFEKALNVNDVTADDEDQYEHTEQSFEPQVPETNFTPTPTKELDKKINKQLKDFSSLLDSLSSLEDKKKALWKQIYENSVTDRKNAYILFGDLYKDVHNNPNEHAIHGPILAKYLERMEKSNQQLIKLAEMIDEVAEEEEEILTDEDSIYDKIQKGNK